MEDDSSAFAAALAAYRAGTAAWSDLACADAQDDDDLWTDPHAPTRARVLIALQYDRRPEDRPLIEYLFDQEVERHTKEPYAGLHQALDRAAYLLAAYHDPAHVLRVWHAKVANFDTYCGLDVRYLVAAGYEPTLAFLRQAADDPERQAIRGFLDLYDPDRFAPAALDAWWRELEQRFPPTLAAESPRARLDRALDDGDLDAARHWLAAWEASEPPTHALLTELAAYWEWLDDLDRASALQRRIIASIPDGDFAILTRFVATCKLAELLRRQGDLPAAWQALADAERLHDAEPDWMAESARRDLAWEAIRLAAAVPLGNPLGPQALTWACDLIARGCPLSAALLEEGRAVAALLGDHSRAEWLASLETAVPVGAVDYADADPSDDPSDA